MAASRIPKQSFSVIVPVHNEEQAIKGLLTSLREECQRTGFPYEVIVIDDGSTDSTAELVRAFDVRLIHHPYNLGNGAAIKRGIRAARNDVIIMMDGDGQHDPKSITRFLALIQDYDMVVGARGGDSDTEKHRDFANSIYKFLASYICGRKVHDLTSGYRAIRREVATRFVYLLPNTFSYPSTLTMSLERGGYSVAYEPIRVNKRLGKSKINILKDGSRFLVIILRVAVFFAPLKVFLPISGLLVASGFGWYIYRWVQRGILPLGAVLLMIAGLLVLMLALLSEQISYLRYQHSDSE